MPALVHGRARIVVLNYNGGAHLTRCFEALHALDWPEDRLELVLVDNASTDGSADAVARRFGKVRLVRNERNTGFPANNLGLGQLEGVDYVGLVNNDGFVDPGWLQALARVLDEHPEAGAVAAKMLFAPSFVEVVLETSTFVPGMGDSRELGAMVSGLRVRGVDRWSDARFGTGTWPPERRTGGVYRWTSGRSVMQVPVPEARPGDDGGDAHGSVPQRLLVEIELSAETTKKVVLHHGGLATTVEVGKRPRWVSIEMDLDAQVPYDIVQNAGSIVFDDGCGADRGFGERDEGQFDEPAEVFAWCGGSVLLRPSYVEATGAFDERFFLYYEDTDWSWRGRAQGWSYRYEPAAVMRHVHAASSVEGSALFQYHVDRNRLAMLLKNAPLPMFARAVVRQVLVTGYYTWKDCVVPVTRAKRPRVRTSLGLLKAFFGFLRMAPAMAAERRRLRARQVVPDSQLLGWLVKREDP